MSNYFQNGDVIQMRPMIPVAVVRENKAEAVDGEAGFSSPGTTPGSGFPPVHRRGFIPLIVACAVLWAIFVGLAVLA